MTTGMWRPCRVLVIAPSPALLGGISSLARALCMRLRREPTIRVDFLPIDPALPGPLRRLQSVKYVRTVVTSLFYGLLLLSRVFRCDVVHLYSASYTSFLLASTPAILVARVFRKPIILNYHSGDAEGHLIRWPSAVLTMRLVDRIVVSSEFLARVFAGFGLQADVLPSPIDLDGFVFRERARLRPVFLTNRLLEPIYNVACVLRAFSLIQEVHPEARLTVAGEGWQRPDLEALARDLSLAGVEFVGRIRAEEMPEYYERTDIYLSATDVDNVPSSIIEAMAAGIPVVTTNAGGIPYLISHEETCLMVERDDHERLAAESLRLLTDPALALAVTHRARHQSRQFVWSCVRDEWIRLYAHLAERRSGGPAGHRIASAVGTSVAESAAGSEGTI